MRKSFGPPTRTSRCRTVRVPALTECLPYALAMLPGHSLQVLYTEGLRQDWPSPFRPRGPLSPVAFPGGARRKAAVACRLFRQDRGSSKGFLTPPPGDGWGLLVIAQTPVSPPLPALHNSHPFNNPGAKLCTRRSSLAVCSLKRT